MSKIKYITTTFFALLLGLMAFSQAAVASEPETSTVSLTQDAHHVIYKFKINDPYAFEINVGNPIIYVPYNQSCGLYLYHDVYDPDTDTTQREYVYTTSNTAITGPGPGNVYTCVFPINSSVPKNIPLSANAFVSLEQYTYDEQSEAYDKGPLGTDISNSVEQDNFNFTDVNNVPTVDNIRLVGRTVVGDVSDADAGDVDYTRSCTAVLFNPLDSSSIYLGGTFKNEHSNSEGNLTNVCVANIPENTPEASWNVTFSPVDAIDSSLVGTGSGFINWVHQAPVASKLTLLSKHTLIADVSDDFNHIQGCSFAVAHNSTNSTYNGQYDPFLKTCAVTLPGDVTDTLGVTLTVTDGQNKTGTVSGTFQGSNVVVPKGQFNYASSNKIYGYFNGPTADLGSCSVDLYYTYEDIGISSVGDIKAADATQPGLTDPTVFFIHLNGTIDQSDESCTATVPANIYQPSSTSLPFSVVKAFVAGVPAGLGNVPPTVTNIRLDDNKTIRADADDSDGIVVDCSIAISQGSYSATIPGTYDSTTKICSGDLPADAPHGNLNVIVEATDNDGDTGNDNGTVNHVNAPPVVTNIRLDNNKTVKGDATDSDGVVVSCTINISQGTYNVTIPGVYDGTTKVCSGDLPADAPHGNLNIVIEATDNDGAKGNDSAVVDHNNTPPTVTNIRLDDNKTIRADADDSDGIVVGCTIAISQGSYSATIPGSYNGASKVCSGDLPADAPHGNLNVVVEATDNDGDTGNDNGPVNHVNVPPVVTNIRLDNNKTIKGDASDSDGIVVSCTINISQGAYNVTIPGVYNGTTKVCSGDLPADAPHGNLNVVIEATDNDGAKGNDKAVVNHVNLPPIVEGVHLDNNSVVGRAYDLDGTIVSCQILIEQGNYKATVNGSYDKATQLCRGDLPADAPDGELKLTIIATDNDNAQGSSTAPGVRETASPLQCYANKTVVTNLRKVGNKAVMSGFSPKTLAGKTVIARGLWNNKKVVGRATISADGSWTIKATLPPKKLIGGNKAMYQADIQGVAKQKSIWLKLTRYLQVEKMAAISGNRVAIEGRVDKKYPNQKVDVQVSYNCGKGTVVSSLKVNSKGRFAGKVKFNTSAKVVTIRLRTKAKNNKGTKAGFYTYSIVQPIVLKK